MSAGRSGSRSDTQQEWGCVDTNGPRSEHGRVLTALPLSVVLLPARPTQRSRRMGWSMTPSTGSPLAATKEISVPKSGFPGPGAALVWQHAGL